MTKQTVKFFSHFFHLFVQPQVRKASMYHCIKTEDLEMKIYFLYLQRNFHLEGNSQENDYNNIKRTMVEVITRCCGNIG